MKEHDRTTTKRIQDNRSRVSLLKNTKILIPVHIISQEVFHQLLQVSPDGTANSGGGDINQHSIIESIFYHYPSPYIINIIFLSCLFGKKDEKLGHSGKILSYEYWLHSQ